MIFKKYLEIFFINKNITRAASENEIKELFEQIYELVERERFWFVFSKFLALKVELKNCLSKTNLKGEIITAFGYLNKAINAIVIALKSVKENYINDLNKGQVVQAIHNIRHNSPLYKEESNLLSELCKMKCLSSDFIEGLKGNNRSNKLENRFTRRPSNFELDTFKGKSKYLKCLLDHSLFECDLYFEGFERRFEEAVEAEKKTNIHSAWKVFYGKENEAEL